MSTLLDWSTTSADNANSDAGLTWAEGMATGAVNNSARVMMARIAEWLSDTAGSLIPGGSANALTITANAAYASAYETGITLVFKAASTNTSGTVTLNVNAIGAKHVRKNTPEGEAALIPGDIISGGIYTVRYSAALNGGAGGWLLSGGSADTMTPAGVIVPFAGSTEPAGWLFSYGQAISRTTYARLFAAISTTYGVGDGSTTFNVPDMRGRVAAGKDDMGGTSANRLTDQTDGVNGDTLGDTGGAETHVLTTAQLASHSHDPGTLVTSVPPNTIPRDGWGVTASSFSPFVSSTSGRIVTGSGGAESAETLESLRHAANDITLTNSNVAPTGATATAGTDAAHNNLQPTIVLNSIIKF